MKTNKEILNQLLNTLLILFSILITGLFIPLLISTIIVIFTDNTYNDCLNTISFSILSIMCIIFSSLYYDEYLK